MRLARLIPLLLTASLVTACAASDDAIGYGTYTLLRHRLAGEDRVVAPRGLDHERSVEVAITVSAEGRVIDARVAPGESLGGADPLPLLAEARRWTFRPFHYRGEPVAAKGSIQIDYTPAERGRRRGAGFPEVDYGSLEIELFRSGCFGPCPVYSVTIGGDGRFEFVAEEKGRWQGVLVPGVHRGQIDRATLDQLVERFRAARFFGLKARYEAQITDNPTYVLSFRTAGQEKTVVDYVGEDVGMPVAVTALQNAVDAAAGTARWVRGTRGTAAALAAAGWDIGSPAAAALAVKAAERDTATDAFFLELIAAGLPLETAVADGEAAGRPVGEALLLGSIRQGRTSLFEELGRRGWLARVERDRLGRAFAEKAGGCEPGIAPALVAAGVDPNARTVAEPGSYRASGGTALMAVVEPHGPCRNKDDAAALRTLLELGAHVNAADDEGQTALYRVDDPDMLERLLAAGARADVRDRAGRSPALAAWNERIILGLLDAGADPAGRKESGKTLRQVAKEQDMTVLLARLKEGARRADP